MILRDTQKNTAEKSQSFAANAIMHISMQVLWGNIWRGTPEKRRTNATSVLIHHLKQAIWEGIWKNTVGKSLANVTNVSTHLTPTWADIEEHTLTKKLSNFVTWSVCCCWQFKHFPVTWFNKRKWGSLVTNVNCWVIILHPMFVMRDLLLMDLTNHECGSAILPSRGNIDNVRIMRDKIDNVGIMR